MHVPAYKCTDFLAVPRRFPDECLLVKAMGQLDYLFLAVETMVHQGYHPGTHFGVLKGHLPSFSFVILRLLHYADVEVPKVRLQIC